MTVRVGGRVEYILFRLARKNNLAQKYADKDSRVADYASQVKTLSVNVVLLFLSLFNLQKNF